ncbi:c-type cytochrome domain-containing protein [Magnetofaba australis]|uniref:Putative transmembrane region and signal peptide prediction n=1 Tax=Magnetofaba australis IT-1 TaxID=1434232 RepID=A0A1Y2K8M7_9PROT|nr:c-type cytochrome domain-containing protein [Magnetofaba australis]OSM06796.1 putative transmembrane region and signal peptide prediction [Magnetofaba australis IT-1]
MRNSRQFARTLGAAALALGLFSGIGSASAATVTYVEDVEPIIQYRCLECHRAGGPGVVYSGLNLESYEGLMAGTRHGPVITPGSPMTSNLLVLVDGRAGIRMPHDRKRLTKCEIDILRKWIAQGAKKE